MIDSDRSPIRQVPIDPTVEQVRVPPATRQVPADGGLQEVYADPVAKYTSFARGIAEFLVVAAVLYLLGRAVVLPLGRWAIARRGIDRTLAVTLRCGLRAVPVETNRHLRTVNEYNEACFGSNFDR